MRVILLAVVATAMAAPTYEYMQAQYPSYKEKENYEYVSHYISYDFRLLSKKNWGLP